MVPSTVVVLHRCVTATFARAVRQTLRRGEVEAIRPWPVKAAVGSRLTPDAQTTFRDPHRRAPEAEAELPPNNLLNYFKYNI